MAARRDAAGLLNAFDATRERVHAAAVRVYERGRRGSYDVVSI